jgi:hypothetical protein
MKKNSIYKQVRRHRYRGGEITEKELKIQAETIDKQIADMQAQIAEANKRLGFAEEAQKGTDAGVDASNRQADKDRFKTSPSVQRTWETVSGFFGPVWKVASRYVVLFIVLILILYGFNNLFSSSSTNTNTDPSSYYTVDTSQWDKLKAWGSSVIQPGFNLKYSLSMFDLNPAMQSAVPRTQGGGRCDNVNHIDMNNGFCKASTEPKDYAFNIDTATLPDWSMLPDQFKQMNANKLKLYMPYSVEDSFYAPQCAQTYYIDDKGNKHVVDLYTADNGLTCGLKTKASQAYTTSYNRDNSGYGYTNPVSHTQ